MHKDYKCKIFKEYEIKKNIDLRYNRNIFTRNKIKSMARGSFDLPSFWKRVQTKFLLSHLTLG